MDLNHFGKTDISNNPAMMRLTNIRCIYICVTCDKNEVIFVSDNLK